MIPSDDRHRLIYNGIIGIDLLSEINAKLDTVKQSMVFSAHENFQHEFPLIQSVKGELKPHTIIEKPVSMRK